MIKRALLIFVGLTLSTISSAFGHGFPELSDLPADIRQRFTVDGTFKRVKASALGTPADSGNVQSMFASRTEPLFAIEQLNETLQNGEIRFTSYQQLLFSKEETQHRALKIGPAPDHALSLTRLGPEISISKIYHHKEIKWGPQNTSSRRRATISMTYQFHLLAQGFGDLLMESVSLQQHYSTSFLSLRLFNGKTSGSLFDIRVKLQLKTSQGVLIPAQHVVDFDFAPDGEVGLIYMDDRGRLMKTRMQIPIEELNGIAARTKVAMASYPADFEYQFDSAPLELLANNLVPLTPAERVKYQNVQFEILQRAPLPAAAPAWEPPSAAAPACVSVL